MSSKIFQQFVKRSLGLTASFFLIIGLLNFIIDPFNIYRTPLIHNLNDFKTTVIKHERLHKAIAIAQLKPKALLLGSSRVLAGLNPDDLQQITGYSAYNGSFSGATFEEVYHYFEHALYHQPNLKTVVVGLDFFGLGKGKPAEDFAVYRLKTFPFHIKDILTTLFSYQVLLNSWKTVKSSFNQPLKLTVLQSNGQSNPTYVATPEGNPIIKKGDLAYLKLAHEKLYQNYQVDEHKLALFEKLVQQCQQRGIDLKVFICPSQAVYWELLYRKQLWGQLENIKERLSAVHPLWDFSGFNSITQQTIQLDQGPLYFECSHFRPCVGRLILKKMYGKTDHPTDFGLLLTPKTVKQAFRLMHLQAIDWLNQQENILDRLQTVSLQPL